MAGEPLPPVGTDAWYHLGEQQRHQFSTMVRSFSVSVNIFADDVLNLQGATQNIRTIRTGSSYESFYDQVYEDLVNSRNRVVARTGPFQISKDDLQKALDEDSYPLARDTDKKEARELIGGAKTWLKTANGAVESAESELNEPRPQKFSPEPHRRRN